FISSNTVMTKHLSEVNYLKLQNGTKAGNGFAIGATSMLVISLISLMEVQSDNSSQLRPDAGLILLGFTFGGGLIGSAIGSSFPKYETYYVNMN
ncbi:MAG: hypothetical protein AAFY41_19150, partial [Bacteroidota bacterium]